MSIRRSAAFATVLLLACCTTALHAPATTSLSQVARVKLFPTQPGAKAIIGNVTDLASDTVVVVPEGSGESLTFDRSDLRKIEASQGKKGNALLGLAVGVGVGAAVGLGVCSGDEGYNCKSGSGNYTAAVTAGFAAILGGIGAGVGAVIKTERWAEAEFPQPPPVTLGVGKDGSVRLAFSLRI